MLSRKFLYSGNLMAYHDLDGISMIVSSCTISFTVSHVLLLKEKVKPVQFAALAVCKGAK